MDVKSYLVQVLATGIMWLVPLIPLVLWVAWTMSKAAAVDLKQLMFVAVLVFVDLACVMAPRFSVFSRLDWNWQGKLLEIAWVLVLTVFPGYSLARLGIKGHWVPGTLPWLGTAAVIAVFVGLLPWMRGMQLLPDRETLLFELTMPSVAEEFVFRGVFQSLLNETFGRPWRFAGAKFGWGALITAALFTIAHAAVFGRNLHLITSVAGAILAFAAAALLGWVRERAGSVWPCVALHSVVNVTPFLATWIFLPR